jgi:hypothetical protein
MTFYEYVAGKTIAVVGPAPVPYDQTAEIDAHDIVYRCSYGFTWQLGMDESPAGSCWTAGVFPQGTGTRVDVSFYNGMATRQRSPASSTSSTATSTGRSTSSHPSTSRR